MAPSGKSLSLARRRIGIDQNTLNNRQIRPSGYAAAAFFPGLRV